MKKNTMATAIIAGLAGVAGIANISTAVNVNPDGVGQVLLYPYYTVNDGNITAMSVVNTTEQGKAVKVRFLDAMNSREVLDFNLYLSGFDVWTAVLRQGEAAGDPAIIYTRDNSCTVPGIKAGIFQLPRLVDGTRYFPFRTTFFNDQSTLAGSTLRAKGPTSGNARTRSGYIELIEMGTIRNETGFGFALTHNSSGVPNDCEALEGAWLAAGTPGGSGEWLAPGQIGVKDTIEPSGGLFGAAAIVKLAEGTYINYNAEAVDGFSAARIHTQPGADTPNLNSGNSPGGGPITSYVFDRGRLITSNWSFAFSDIASAQAVSALFMRDAVFNEWEADPELGAVSEWIVTLPTRKFFVTGSTAFRPPFMTGWSGCERYSGRIYDREEKTFRILEGSPATGSTVFCREANVLWFQDNRDSLSRTASPATGEPAYLQIPTYFELFNQVQYTFRQGWFWMGFYDPDAVNNAGIRDGLRRPALVENAPTLTAVDPRADEYFGLPAIGFWAYKVTNASANAAVGNFGGAYPHRASRACFKGGFGSGSPCDANQP